MVTIVETTTGPSRREMTSWILEHSVMCAMQQLQSDKGVLCLLVWIPHEAGKQAWRVWCGVPLFLAVMTGWVDKLLSGCQLRSPQGGVLGWIGGEMINFCIIC